MSGIDMEAKKDQAEAYFAGGCNCAQSVLAPYALETGIALETILKLATALGAGIGRSGEVCGAVSGAALAIGLYIGQADPQDVAAKECTYAAAQELMQAFRSQYGSARCGDLVGCDLSDPAALKVARESGVFTRRCPQFVRFTAGWTAEYLSGRNLSGTCNG